MKDTICTLLFSLLILNCSKESSVSTPVEPPRTDSQLIEQVQRDVLKYFYDYAHPVSKLARERLHEDDLSFDQNTVAIGGSGFGLLNLILACLKAHSRMFLVYSDQAITLGAHKTSQLLKMVVHLHGCWQKICDQQDANPELTLSGQSRFLSG